MVFGLHMGVKNMDENVDNRWDPVWFIGFCTENEIARIINPQKPIDFLLRERADIVADNIRYQRVYMNKARKNKRWTFESSFNVYHYNSVLNRLSQDDKFACKNFTYGDMFSNDVNGYAWNDEKWGRFVSLNESLQFYMKFCNLAILDFKDHVPDYIRKNALRIAIRVMLKQEAMDFYMDPRGIVPYKIGKEIHRPIKYELQYIAGHEFAHHLCGHLDDKNITKKMMLKIGDKEYCRPIYNVNQLQELEADIASLVRPEYNDKEYIELLQGALIWFVSLGLAEWAQNIINPALAFDVKTHPSSDERYNYILENVKIPDDFNLKYIEKVKENAKIMGEFLEEDLSDNYDIYDFYGSCYLDEPNTQWRGKQLIDRVDYY